MNKNIEQFTSNASGDSSGKNNNSPINKDGEGLNSEGGFDKQDRENPLVSESSFNSLAEERKLAEYIKDQIIYAGLFVDPKELYDKFPTSLSHRIRDPHVTTAYRPNVEKLFLDSLNSSATIRAIGYGNDGQNEGLLVEVTADDPAIQKTLNERIAPDNAGELKSVPTHITLSIADGAEAVNTKYLHFEPLENPVELTGRYELFRNDGVLLSDKDTIKEMQNSDLSLPEVEDPDRL